MPKCQTRISFLWTPQSSKVKSALVQVLPRALSSIYRCHCIIGLYWRISKNVNIIDRGEKPFSEMARDSWKMQRFRINPILFSLRSTCLKRICVHWVFALAIISLRFYPAHKTAEAMMSCRLLFFRPSSSAIFSAVNFREFRLAQEVVNLMFFSCSPVKSVCGRESGSKHCTAAKSPKEYLESLTFQFQWIFRKSD